MKRQGITVCVLILAFLLNPVAGLHSRLNVIPGGAQVAHAQEQLDLVITDVWSEGTDICYQIRNIGSDPVPAGHETFLTIDGVPVVGNWVNVALATGERLNRCFFNVVWQCSAQEDTIKVNADNQNHVTEDDETNNEAEETWLCDTTAPQITSGPTVSGIGQTTATISWTTDENSDSEVQFGGNAGEYEDQESSATPTTDHEVVLTGLSPASTYHYIVESTDASGNAVVSGTRFFRTALPADGIAPEVSFFSATGKSLPMEFSASATDNVELNRVEFFLDEELMETDYSAPFRAYLDPAFMGLDPATFFTEHDLSAEAFDSSGAVGRADHVWDAASLGDCDSTDMSLEIQYPYHGQRIYTDTFLSLTGRMTVEVRAVEATGYSYRVGGLGRSGEREPDWAVVTPVEFFLDGDPLPTTYVGQVWGDPLVRVYTFAAADLAAGWYELSARAETSAGCPLEDYVDIDIAGFPAIDVTRTVTRHGNYFEVELQVTNVGQAPAYGLRIVDSLVGFQIARAPSPTLFARYDYEPIERRCSIDIARPRSESLGVGETDTYTYWAVPIQYVGDEDYTLGRSGYLTFHARGILSRQDLPYTTWIEVPGEPDPVSVDQAVEDAIGMSDYLLVTNPYNLLALYDNYETNELLSKMAELAALRNGVLGYFNGYQVLKSAFSAADSIASGHLWGPPTNDEISLADIEGDLLRSYSATDELELSDGRLPITHDLNSGDALAIGNVAGWNNVGGTHARSEYVVADGANRQVHVYQYDYVPDSHQFRRWTYPIEYDTGDGFAVGNVVRDPYMPLEEEDIVVANEDGTVEIYSHDRLRLSFASPFESGDGLAVGEVLGDAGFEEILITSNFTDSILIYTEGELGYIFGFPELVPEDDLALGDVVGDDKEEILIADESEDRIYIYGYDPGLDDFVLISDFSYYFEAEDALSVADMLLRGKAEILVARGGTSTGHSEGDIEILSYQIGEPPGDRYSLDALLNPGGEWAEAMADTWLDEGYLLLVGEAEIIPAFSADWFLSDYDDRAIVDYMDREYGDTIDDLNRPELSVGRIIGDDAERLQMPIQTSIDLVNGDAEFDNSDAYAASGWERGASGGADEIFFGVDRERISQELVDNGFTVFQEHTPSESEFFTHAGGKDVIFLAGHGTASTWDVLSAGEVNASFGTGDIRPLVYAASCLTGRYPAGDSLAETFLNKGASVYIGATESAPWPWARMLAKEFAREVSPSQTVGSALKSAKRYRMGQNNYSWDPRYNRFTCAMFHLYGDPKLALASASGVAVIAPQAMPSLAKDPTGDMPLSSLQVVIPDYEVTVLGDEHYVDIPGGGTVMEPHKPMVPAIDFLISYPKGTQIQDVNLVGRGGLSADTGLNIPNTQPVRPKNDTSGAGAMSVSAEPWPDRDFAWTTIQNPGGGISLALTIYPFYYYTETTNVEFYKNYTFTVEYTASNVEITAFTLDRHAYVPGAVVGADVYLFSSSELPQDLIVEAEIWSETHAELAAGLPLRTLQAMRGLASFAVQWDSTGFDPGDYRLQILIRDASGVLLDSESKYFTLGISAGVIKDLSATPKTFDIGDNIATSLTFENVGTEIISGTATIIVQDEAGTTLQEFRHTVSDLTPGESLTFDDMWDSSGGQLGAYTMVGYVSYDGTIAGPAIVPLHTKWRIYLPFISR